MRKTGHDELERVPDVITDEDAETSDSDVEQVVIQFMSTCSPDTVISHLKSMVK